MQDALVKFDQLEQKVKEIGQKLEYLKKENIMLIEENVRLKEEVEKIKLRVTQSDPIGNKESLPEKDPAQADKLRREIDKYIVEIDKCLEWINDL